MNIMKLMHLTAKEKDYVLTRIQLEEKRAGLKKGKRLPRERVREIYQEARTDYAKYWAQ